MGVEVNLMGGLAVTVQATVAEQKVRIEDVTPEKAAQWIQRNHERNRRRRPAKVAEYAADMRAGRWFLGTQVIAFDPDGTLVNGQHTLEAVVKSGATIRSIVLYGCPRGSMMVIDGGMKRSSDDHFSMAGKNYPTGCGATVRRVLMGLANYAGRSITDQTVSDFMDRHGADVAFVHQSIGGGPFAKASVRAVLVRAKIRKVPGERLERFCEVLKTGIMQAGENGAVLLRNYMTDQKTNAAGSGSARAALYAYAEPALKAFVEGERVKRLEPTGVELFPIPEDKVEG